MLTEHEVDLGALRPLKSGAYPGFQRGGCLRLGPIRKVGGGGGGGGGGQFASGPIRKVGWGWAVAYDGGGRQSAYDGGRGGSPLTTGVQSLTTRGGAGQGPLCPPPPVPTPLKRLQF